MSRIKLRIYFAPGRAEVFITIKGNNDITKRVAAVVDTGAEISLLPISLMDDVIHQLVGREKITVVQAGIAQQAFEAYEALITLFLEDELGNQSPEIQVRVWFADTTHVLVGFQDILDRAILHIDMPNRSGYLEFP